MRDFSATKPLPASMMSNCSQVVTSEDTTSTLLLSSRRADAYLLVHTDLMAAAVRPAVQALAGVDVPLVEAWMTSIQSRSGAPCAPSPKNSTTLLVPALKPA